jgi:hypothetical protein
LTTDLKGVTSQFNEAVEQKNKMQNALLVRDVKLNSTPITPPKLKKNSTQNSSRGSSTGRRSEKKSDRLPIRKTTSMQSIELHKDQINFKTDTVRKVSRNLIPKNKK